MDDAKDQIEKMIPTIEKEIINQEESLTVQLTAAQEALTPDSAAGGNTGEVHIADGSKPHQEEQQDAAVEAVEAVGGVVDPVDSVDQSESGTQKMIGSVVETAVNDAKTQIGSLETKIEGEIMKQKEALGMKLNTAEASLTNSSVEQVQAEHAQEQDKVSGTQQMVGSVVETAVGDAKNQIGTLENKIEKEIVKQKGALSVKLNTAQESLTGGKSVEDGDGGGAGAGTRTGTAGAKKYVPPQWHKDVVIDEDAGIAIHMLNERVTHVPLMSP